MRSWTRLCNPPLAASDQTPRCPYALCAPHRHIGASPRSGHRGGPSRPLRGHRRWVHALGRRGVGGAQDERQRDRPRMFPAPRTVLRGTRATQGRGVLNVVVAETLARATVAGIRSCPPRKSSGHRHLPRRGAPARDVHRMRPHGEQYTKSQTLDFFISDPNISCYSKG